MYLLMGLLSALCWGGTDYLSGKAARELGVFKALFVSQLFGLIVLSLILFVFSIPFELKISGLLTAAIASFCNLLGMIFLLKALSIGKVSVVAPLVSLYGAVTTVLAIISGRQVSWIILSGLFLCILGACLASISPSHDGKRESLASVGFALMSSLSLGLGFWLQGEFAVKELGVIQSLWIYYATALMFLALVVMGRKDVKSPSLGMLGLLFCISCMSLTGFFTLAYGASLGHVAVVTVLSSLASAVTALLGFTLKQERLSLPQLSGLFMIISGVVVLRI
ncbi:EamA family transporter (plasmid) [Pantoea ananatis]|uniref:DMT family transporter n=1 Tax=Pantoea ananas TaxID=553 RepID=UPI000B603151|nr:DMT family transporter [Pantoea ananatis]ASN18079.1 EamA family transporter [Pantoea ananatis]